MDNPYIEYYMKQAGTGITGYEGHRYHVGRGLFGRILKNLKPALKYIGRQGWETIKSVSSGVMSGDTLEDAGKNSLIKTTQNVLADANNKLEKYKKRKQTGAGRKTTRKVAKRKVPAKKKPTKKLTKSKKSTKTTKKKATKKVYKSKKPTKKVYKKRKPTSKNNKIDLFF